MAVHVGHQHNHPQPGLEVLVGQPAIGGLVEQGVQGGLRGAMERLERHDFEPDPEGGGDLAGGFGGGRIGVARG